MKTPDKKYFENPKKYIPLGVYCYTGVSVDSKTGIMKIDTCPFWDKDITKEDQVSGYCHYLKEGDWMDNSWGMFWDQCKICGINDNWDEEDKDIALDKS
jgi:hypothetical protein